MKLNNSKTMSQIQSLTLIVSEASPYARTSRMMVHELDLTDCVAEIQRHPFDNPPELVSANPLAKVPCLVVAFDDGTEQGLFDSHVINHFLNDYAHHKQGAPSLFAELNQSWQQQTAYSLIRGLLDTAVAWQQDKVRGAEGQSEFWQERFVKALDRGLMYLEEYTKQYVEEHQGSATSECNILSLNAIALLEYLDFRHPDYPWRAQNTQLVNYHQANAQRPSVQRTQPKG